METTERFEFMGRALRMPVQVARASAVSATYLARSEAANHWIRDSGLSVLQPVPGRTLVSLAFLHYEEGDFGRYDEVCIALPVLTERTGTLKALRTGAFGLFLRYLPVTDAFSAQAGVELFGFPKWCADIRIEARGGRGTHCHFASDGQNVFTLELAARQKRVPGFGPLSIDAYSVCDGVLRRCRFTTWGEDVAVRPGGARLDLGGHAIAKELSMLQLSRHALCVSSIGRMRASFGAPEIVRAK